jgi:hypothetical protein
MERDVFATSNGKLVEGGPEFETAHEEVLKLAGAADGYLRLGGLNCSQSKDMLKRALKGKLPRDSIAADELQRLAEAANWHFEYEMFLAWAYWSARTFFEVCAQHEYGIAFSSSPPTCAR